MRCWVAVAVAVTALIITGGGRGCAPHRILVDTDVDTDDFFALLYLLKLNTSQFQLEGISISANAWTSAGHAVNQIYDLLYMMGRDDVAVGVGGEGGILQNGTILPNVGGYLPIIEQGMTTVGGCRYRRAIPVGLGGRLDIDANYGIRKAFLPQGTRKYTPLQQPTAQEVLIEKISAGPITLLVIGAHTNIAIFLMNNPHLKKNVEHIYIMGGGVRSSNPTGCCPKNASSTCVPRQCGDRGNMFTDYNTNPYAEFNIFGDPFAAYQVIHSGIPITLVPLDATNTIPINEQFFDAFEKSQDTYEAQYIFKSLKMARDTWFDNEFYSSYFMWDSFAAGIAVSIMSKPNNQKGENEFAEMEYMNITVITSNKPYGVSDGSNPFFDGRRVPKFNLEKGGVHSGHVQQGLRDPLCFVNNGKGKCQDGYTAEVSGPDSVRVLVATKAKPNKDVGSSLDREYFISFLNVLKHPQNTGRFNFTTQFPYYKEVTYKPDFENKTPGKPVVFDMDMSAGDFLALFYLLKVPVQVIDLKAIIVSPTGWTNSATIDVIYDLLHMMGRDDIPVGLGDVFAMNQSDPIFPPVGECKYVKAIPHGSGGLLDSDTLYGLARDLPRSPRRYTAENSVKFGAPRDTDHPELRQPLAMEVWNSVLQRTKPRSINSKTDKYLFMRRDEPSNTFQLSSRETSDAAGSYVLQKRPLAVSAVPEALEKHEDTGIMSQDIAASTVKAEIAVADQVQSDGIGHASPEMTRSIEPVEVASKSMGRPHLSGEMALPNIVNETSQSTNMESKTYIDVKNDGNLTPSGPHEDFQQIEQGFLATSDEVKQVKHHKLNVDGVPKKIKVHKRPANDLKSETSGIEGKKKKKMKKGLNLQPTSGHLEKISTSEKAVQLSGQSEKSEPMQVDASTSNLMPMDSMAEVNIELPHLLGDLQALALDPFHGVKRGIPAVTRQFFLRFRSLIYQKSLPVSPPIVTENEAAEVRRPPSSVGTSDGPDDHARASSLIKPVKHIVRPDDPTKAGRKRALSDRQEEITEKRWKKIKNIKALAAEKKAGGQKTSEARQGDGKESMAQAPPKVVKPELTRKVERPAKAVEPTILVIKFPLETSLPSVAELKARFARFGPIDQSGLRVFWKTSTCRVVFLHKVDAQSAYKYALANQSLFGNVGVKCFLREFGDASSEVSEAAKARGDNGANESPRVKNPAVVQRQSSAQQPLPQPTIQLKSILKKSTADEPGQLTGNGGSSKGTPRVKFMLGGEESSRGEQLMVGNRNSFNSVSFADGGAPSSVAMDFNSKNVQKAISQPPLPNTPPPPTQFTKILQHNLHNSEMAPRNTPNFINATTSATAPTVDISQQMISLLTRCNDIVNNLTSLLGYVPYHPL